jgi:uncharacterized membrane protein YjgN (DUF898 family)
MDIAAQNESGTGTTESKTYSFSFQGNGGTLFGIQIVNLLLIIITLGIYYFWAKARVRSYLWSQIDFDRERFAYHGTGKETLLGWLKAVAIFGIPIMVCQKVPMLLGAPKALIIIGIILTYLLIAVFVPVATVGSRRYRMSRSSFRGIRFSFRGKWLEYAKLFLAGSLLSMVTLNFYSPYFDMRRQKFFMGKSYFGNRNFGFDGKGKDLLGSYALAFFLALPTLFVSLLWYGYKKTKYIWNHITFDGARFQSTITFRGLMNLYLGNGLVLIFTLGFGAPWTRVRTLCYFLAHLTLEGCLDLSTIVQEAQESTAFGEEIGDFMAMDFDLG